jgi:hypothetical protein
MQTLDERFADMKQNGLLDVKFDIRRTPPDKGLGEPKRKFEDTFSAETVVLQRFFSQVALDEVGRLYDAVDAGHEMPLDFKDSTKTSNLC